MKHSGKRKKTAKGWPIGGPLYWTNHTLVTSSHFRFEQADALSELFRGKKWEIENRDKFFFYVSFFCIYGNVNLLPIILRCFVKLKHSWRRVCWSVLTSLFGSLLSDHVLFTFFVLFLEVTRVTCRLRARFTWGRAIFNKGSLNITRELYWPFVTIKQTE